MGCLFRAFVVLAALVLTGSGAFADGRDDATPITRARELAGRDVAAAREALAALRQKAMATDDLASRLAIDEIDCRVLSDTDAITARQVAQAGLAAAPSAADPAQRLALLRLRACAAGVALDLGETAQGSRELEAVLRATEDNHALTHARALALLERGLHRSRRGDLVNGQQDLLQACRSLEALQVRADLELCQSHLANHYKRMGDTAEALRLLTQLLKSARERGATMDIGVYAHGVAQVHYERRQWPQAKAAFEEELAIARATRDKSGISYAEYGLGHTMLHLGQPSTALAHAQQALAMLNDGSDPLQQSRNFLLEVKAYLALGRPQDAIADLKRIEQSSSLKSDDDMLRADLLAMTAEVEAKLGHWREAYQALTAWQALNEQTQAQRLSEQSARLREEFNREKDAAEVEALRKVNAQGQRLQQTQGVALALFVALLAAASAFGVHKVKQGRRLHALATIDELTGLPNRRATLSGLADQLQIAHRLKRPLAVMMVDVDHFKRINDTHGHAVGDEVLQHLGRTLAASLRQHDRVGRLGGEEFLVVLPDANPEQAANIGERMRHAVAMGPCPTATGLLSITISVGIACDSSDDATTATALVTRADRALYAAKSAGRNTVSVRAVPEAAEVA